MEQEKKAEQKNPSQKNSNPHHRRRRRPNHKPENRGDNPRLENSRAENANAKAAQQPKAQKQEAKPALQKQEKPQAQKNTQEGGGSAPHHKRRDHRRSQRRSQEPLVESMESASAFAPAPTYVAEENAADSAPGTPPPADVLETSILRTPPVIPDEEAVEVVGIRFKVGGKTYYFAPGNLQATRGSFAIVETARGPEYGEVTLANTKVRQSDIVPPLRPVLRLATEADQRHHEENLQKEKMAMKVCAERIAVHKLDMKLIDAQYTFDNSKLLFYFTSAGRVDFRELVKDLASVFRTRIELRQIGIRDEAKLLGGLGLCGRPLCCSVFLTDFGQVSIKMAKEQNLSLNSAKISGACGRLMCCLRFEHDTYEQEIRQTPPVDALVKTPEGNGVVTEINPLQGMIKVRLLEKADNPPVSYHRDQVEVLQNKYKRDGGNADKS